MADANWKEQVHRRYQELKELGKSFFPYIIFKDTVAVFAVFAVLLVLAVTAGVELQEVVDPTDTTYNPRPEWYFLFLFQALKFFPGSMEAIAAVVLPSFAILFLLLLPFLDRGPRRHPLNRPFFTAIGVVAVVGFVVLTVLGWMSPLLNPVVKKDPMVLEGRRLYAELRCAYCHSIQGHGGVAAPELTTVGARRNREWLLQHFRNPGSMTPGSIMPKLNLLPEEVEALAAYMQTLGGEGPFSPQAPRLFKEHCMTCHALGGKGGNVGPDLTSVKTYRDKGYLYRYIEDPASQNPDASMPGFKGVLTDAQIEDLSRYLLSSSH